MPLQFDKLRLSTRQKCSPNSDPATADWPETFFWTDGLILLRWARAVVQHGLPDCDAEARENFWRGIIPARLLEHLPARLAKCSPAQMVEYCQAWRSRDTALTILITKARREKLNPEGKVALGDVRTDEQVWVLRQAESRKSVNGRGIPGLICAAAKQNDVRFFIRLGKALQARKPAPEVDWSRPDPLACFLVENWCEGISYRSSLPALCFFTDPALADFCTAAFGKRPGNPTPESVRQWRRRLGLKAVRSPKVKEVIWPGGALLFA